MELAVSYDNNGNVLTLFNPATIGNQHGTLRYVPAPGEKHEVIDLPAQFEAEPFESLPQLLRINAAGARPIFERKP